MRCATKLHRGACISAARARNADVYAGLAPVNRAITHGRCRGVGVAGLVLGGGIGFSQRLRGLTCDQLLEMEIVTAAGERLRCNESENADLSGRAAAAAAVAISASPSP